MSNSTNNTLVGWVGSSDDRGTSDLLWSCCITIVLCTWVSTYPSVPSRNDLWYHHLIDKLNLAMIGMLGPDLLCAIATGQLASARRSVKQFKNHPEVLGDRKWTLRHAFFADMGGFLLKSPDYPEGFPVDTEQLFYLIQHGHVDFPELLEEDIKEKSKIDTLARVITLWQMAWFSLTEFLRVANGYPMTTLELTALSFSCFMLITSLFWLHKPSISRSVDIYTKDDISIREIREAARYTTHPSLPEQWYRTPLTFLSRPPSHVEASWAYCSHLTYLIRFPIFNRPISTANRGCWDRFPSDRFLALDGSRAIIHPVALVLQIPFSMTFLAAWTFYFPTDAERWLWRACAVYHVLQTAFMTVYFLLVSDRAARTAPLIGAASLGTPAERKHRGRDEEEAVVGEGTCHRRVVSRAWTARLRRARARIDAWLEPWRNISPDGDPNMAIKIRWILPMWFTALVYIMIRIAFYVQDVVALRQQPEGVYKTVNRFVPFM